MKKVCDTSLNQIRIADLIDEMGINRNTFYYHFSSKYDIAMWVLQEDLAVELTASFPPEELVYLPSSSKDAKGDRVPYYVHVESGAHALDESGFLKALVRCTLRRRDFYRKLFSTKEDEFNRSFMSRYYPAVEQDIKFVLGGRYMPTETIKYLANIGTRDILMTVQYNLTAGENANMLDEKVNPFWNFFHEALSAAIMNHPINRYRPKDR